MVFHVKVVMDEFFGPTTFATALRGRSAIRELYSQRLRQRRRLHPLLHENGQLHLEPAVGAVDRSAAREYQYVDPKTNRLFMKVPVHAPGVRTVRRVDRGVALILHLENTGSSRPRPSMKWTREETSTGRPIIIRGERFISMRAPVSVFRTFGSISKTRTIRISISLGIPRKRIQHSSRESWPRPLGRGHRARLLLWLGNNPRAADGLERKWIGIDNGEEAMRTTLKRFEHGLEPMGDFVSERETDLDDEPQGSLGLFSQVPHGADAHSAAAHTPIRDYVLLAEEDRVEKAMDFVRTFGLSPCHSLKRTACNQSD